MRKLFFVTLIWLLPSLAEARPRDQVMSGAYRCASVPASRQWLDCYYGAAQPQRAQLGLPPALAAQLRLAASPPAGGTIPDEEVRSQVMVGASRCYPITDERQWLDCYYAAAAPMRSALGLQAPGVASRQTEPAPAPAARGPASRSGTITARVEAFRFDRRNFTVTLSNGQVWQQVAGDTNYAHWNEPPTSYVAIVSHGAFGSFNLQIKGSPQIFKVRQVR